MENAIKEELNNVNTKLNAELSSQQSRIRSYNNLLKTDLTPLETRVVRSSIVSAKQKIEKTKKRNAKWMARMTRRANESTDRLAKFQKNVKQEIRKVIKEQLREEKAFAKEELKEQKMVETADDKLTDTFRESLAEAQRAVRVEMVLKIHKATEKETKNIMREEKKRAASTRKAEKQREMEEKKAANATRKQRVALEKERKQMEKIQKAQEKEDAKKAKEDAKKAKEDAKKAKEDAKKQKEPKKSKNN